MSARVSKMLVVLPVVLFLDGALSAAAAAGHRPSMHGHTPHVRSIVGTWIVEDAAAPFPFHMYVFNADGTMQQANPDAGDAKTSDSDGKGIWVATGDRIKGKWVEITADRATHKFAGRLELSFDIRVQADRLTGSRSATPFDADGKPSGGPFQGDFTGTRVTLP